MNIQIELDWIESTRWCIGLGWVSKNWSMANTAREYTDRRRAWWRRWGHSQCRKCRTWQPMDFPEPRFCKTCSRSNILQVPIGNTENWPPANGKL